MSDLPRKRRRLDRARRRRPAPAVVDRPTLLVSVPKAGSSLLRALTLALPGTAWAGHAEGVRELANDDDRLARLAARLPSPQAGDVFAAHLPYSPSVAGWLEDRGVAVVFLYRDPRDYAVSWVHQVRRHSSESLPYRAFAALAPDDDLLLATIRGLGRGREEHRISSTDYPSVRRTYEAFLGWLELPATLAVTFEQLVDRRGGAPSVEARRAVARLAHHLGLGEVGEDDPLVERALVEGLDPDRSYTYRRGRVGGWREAFSAEHLAEFERVAGDLPARLGYPGTAAGAVAPAGGES